MKTVQQVAVWILVLVMAFAFVMLGLSKLVGQSSAHWAERFVGWGYPANLRYIIGALEIISGIGLLVPVAARPAAGALVILMAGAFYTHISHGELSRVIPPFIFGTLAFLIFLWRHPRKTPDSNTVPGHLSKELSKK